MNGQRHLHYVPATFRKPAAAVARGTSDLRPRSRMEGATHASPPTLVHRNLAHNDRFHGGGIPNVFRGRGNTVTESAVNRLLEWDGFQ